MEKLPSHFEKNAENVLEFNRQIIEATKDLAVCYKINTAFYEWMGAKGWEIMEATKNSIPSSVFTIADAKRGDIGNTSFMYAKTFFETLDFDAVTVHPYMGKDSVMPFLEYKNKWTIILALTSNKGSEDFEILETEGEPLYNKVLRKCSEWGTPDNTMYVTGATKASQLSAIRNIVPEHFLLVPGVGAQGGNVKDVCDAAATKDVGLLINASRSIIYASSGKDFAEKAREESLNLIAEMTENLGF